MPLNFNLSIRNGALTAIAGFILSAPATVPLIMLIAPQPSWISVEVFKANYHPIQTLPYYLGFILISGLVILVIAHKSGNNAQPSLNQNEIRLARILINIFATLIIFNYICQTTFIPHLVHSPSPINDSLIAAFSMSNPTSLSWALEMWGYLIMAKALWLLRVCYRDRKTSLPSLLTLNLFMSMISVVWTIIDPSWVETTLGLILYFAWNVVMILILIIMYRSDKDPAVSNVI